MTGTINFTGRRKLGQKHLSVALREDAETRSFDAEIAELPDTLPADARVFIEAYHRGTSAYMRFSFGNVGEINSPPDRRLLEVYSEVVHFALKIVGRGENKVNNPLRMMYIIWHES